MVLAIETEHLKKKFGDILALKDLSFAVEEVKILQSYQTQRSG